jgi:hypothetical protein
MAGTCLDLRARGAPLKTAWILPQDTSGKVLPKRKTIRHSGAIRYHAVVLLDRLEAGRESTSPLIEALAMTWVGRLPTAMARLTAPVVS